MHRTYLFIVNGADLEYNKKSHPRNFMVNDALLDYYYIKKNRNKGQNKN